uniref:RNA polymerase beta'' subunit n=1 Tax=Pallavicinia lyellii TaxID=56939 RepID=UPI001D122FCD|nr:RNA polymerase beta'' subunit [Pallavicinia lyellii]QZZ24653.1 RNA polymerase beta'' subunit [Pallavicinia lyellii]
MAEPINLVFYNKVMDRTAIKQFISRLIAYFGITYTTHVLDQLKMLGFQQATLYAISLGIDDLLIAPSKIGLIRDAEQHGNLSEKHYKFGDLHAVEKLRQLIETWYATSEYLKQEMNPNFRMTDPLNSVHMMSFSGARGSTSQVHQLVGMRGLMSDPQGQIIDLPIQSNFREGLSLTEYIISCYGARKGVVDTAVRTSDAGYLTRRLVEVVQHIVVRQTDCTTLYGIVMGNSRGKKSIQKLIGHVLAENIYIKNRCFAIRNQDIGASLANKSSNSKAELISMRSPLTCKSMLWICQLCYGWNPANGNLIEVGEAVGIIAGQSIGEPGTQLTLRTFHTGGVFTGDIAEHIRTSFNGIIKFNESLVHPTRTRHGHPAWICYTNLFLTVQSKNEVYSITIPSKSLLLVRNGQYVESKQVIAEIRAKASPSKEKVYKYIYSDLGGEMHWNTQVRHASEYTHSNIHPVLKTCHIWVLSGNSCNKNKLTISFYKNQDKTNSKIFSTKDSSFYPKSKNQLNTDIYHFYLFRTERVSIKSKLRHAGFNYFNNLSNSNIILCSYNIEKKSQSYFLKKNSVHFILKIHSSGILQNNDVFAILNHPKYRLKTSGILKYGTIGIDSTNGNSNFENVKTKLSQRKYKIVKKGHFFFIPEEVHVPTQTLSRFSVRNSEIASAVPTTSNTINSTYGLIKILKKVNNICEVRITPGTIYYPTETYKISRQISVLVPPRKKLFQKFLYDHWTYLQWIVPLKEKPFVLIRPATQYEIFDESNTKNLLRLLKRDTNLEIKTIHYLFYEDGEQIQIVNKKEIQLIQTCLLVHWRNEYFAEKAHVSFLEIKTKNNSRKFLQINLMDWSLFDEKEQRNIYNSRYVLKKNYYDKLFLIRKNQLVNEEHPQGIIRIPSDRNNKVQSLIVLSPLDLLGISKTNKRSGNFLTRKNIKNKYSTEFFGFCTYPRHFPDPPTEVNIIANYSLLASEKKSKKNNLFDRLGYIGNLRNIRNCKLLHDEVISKKHSIIDPFRDTNPQWYFTDEYCKMHKFLIIQEKINLILFKWSFPTFRSPKKTVQEFIFGQFLVENFNISGYTRIPPSGQIIGMDINHLAILRLAKPYLATSGATIHNDYGESVKEGDAPITLAYERLKSGDIIQGLPKVEQLLEARSVNSVSINLENGFEDWNSDMKDFIGNLWGFFLSTKISIEQAQTILVDQIQKVYQSQGVRVSNKHIEIIVRQMTSKVVILEDGMIHIFLPGELIESSRARRMNRVFEEMIFYEPILLGITKASLNTKSFLSEASFQETTRVLAKAALKGRTDWLKGLKENVILGGVVPAGTGSQEVIWQVSLEKTKRMFFGIIINSFDKKIRNTFLYNNTLSNYPAIETVHNVLSDTPR